MFEILFYGVPALLAVLVTIPWRWILPALLPRFPEHALLAASICAVLYAAIVFVLFAGGLLFLIGVPADENGGEAVVLYMQIGAVCTAVAQIAYWVLYALA